MQEIFFSKDILCQMTKHVHVHALTHSYLIRLSQVQDWVLTDLSNVDLYLKRPIQDPQSIHVVVSFTRGLKYRVFSRYGK